MRENSLESPDFQEHSFAAAHVDSTSLPKRRNQAAYAAKCCRCRVVLLNVDADDPNLIVRLVALVPPNILNLMDDVEPTRRASKDPVHPEQEKTYQRPSARE